MNLYCWQIQERHGVLGPNLRHIQLKMLGIRAHSEWTGDIDMRLNRQDHGIVGRL